MKDLFAAVWLARLSKRPHDPSKLIHSETCGIQYAASIPTEKRGLPVIALHGVTPEGENDPRMLSLVCGLAGSGLPAYAPRLEGMASGEVRKQDLVDIVDFAKNISDQSSSLVGLIGFSFGGGYSLIAAADDLLKDRLAFVISIGGYAELMETIMGFFNPEPNVADENRWARLVAFNSFGSAKMLGKKDLEVLRRMVVLSHSPKREEIVFDLSDDLTPGGKRIFHELIGCDENIRDRILDDINSTGLEEHLSPVRHLDNIFCPVYLLHGRYDPTISWEQTAKLNKHFVSLGHEPQRFRISDSFTHVQPGRMGKAGSRFKDILFFASVLGRAFDER